MYNYKLGPAYLFDSNRFESMHVHFQLNRFASTESIQRILLNRFTSTKFPRFLIDYSYFYTRIVISCDQ